MMMMMKFGGHGNFDFKVHTQRLRVDHTRCVSDHRILSFLMSQFPKLGIISWTVSSLT